MAGTDRASGGFWTFLPYALSVLGAGAGIAYATSGSGNANPLIWLVIGLLAGRSLAWALARLGDATGWRR